MSESEINTTTLDDHSDSNNSQAHEDISEESIPDPAMAPRGQSIQWYSPDTDTSNESKSTTEEGDQDEADTVNTIPQQVRYRSSDCSKDSEEKEEEEENVVVQMPPRTQTKSVVYYDEQSLWEKFKMLSGPIFNMLNVVLGAGVVSLPYAFNKSGIIIAVVLLIVVGFVTALSFSFLLWSSKVSNSYTYKDLSKRSMGPSLAIIIDIIIFVDTLGTAAANLILIGESSLAFLQTKTSQNSPYLHPNILIGFSLLITLPLCLIKNISWLSWTSLLSILPILYLIILQIVYLGMNGSPGEIPLVGDYQGMFIALPLFIFAYTCQSTLFPIYNDIKSGGGGHQHMFYVVNWTILITAIANGICGGLGVAGYPNDTKGNIMLNLPEGIATDILLTTMALSTVLSMPVIIWPMRDSMDQLLMGAWRRYKNIPPPVIDPDAEPVPMTWKEYIRFVIETFLIFALTVPISIAVPSFATILGLTGSITKMIICYLFPAIFFLRLARKEYHVLFTWAAWGLLILGLTTGIISTTVTVMDYQQNQITSPVNTTLQY
jgi:amino acid permease